MSKASSNKISELKSLRKDATSSKQEDENNQNNDKISELKSMNKEILMKEDNENQNQNQVLETEQNKEKEKKDEDKQSKQSELIMKDSLINKSMLQ